MKSKPKMQRLLRGVSVLRELRGCMNIVHLHDYFEDERYIHLVLEYCDGDDLFKYLKNAPLKEVVIHDILSQLSRAIQQMRDRI